MVLPGEFSLSVLAPGQAPRMVLPWAWNDRVYTAGHLVMQTMVNRDPSYGFSVMYIEFENMDDAETAASTPEIDPADLTYYQNLTGSRDYLRVLITEQPHGFVVEGYEDILDPAQYNGAILFASTGNVESAGGLPFSSENFSRVCGLAIGAAVDPDDPAADILYARRYYAAENQWLAEDGVQLRVSYRIKFTAT